MKKQSPCNWPIIGRFGDLGSCRQARQVLWTYYDSTAQLMPVRKFSSAWCHARAGKGFCFGSVCEQVLAKGFPSVPSISLHVNRYPVILAGVAKVARHDCG